MSPALVAVLVGDHLNLILDDTEKLFLIGKNSL